MKHKIIISDKKYGYGECAICGLFFQEYESAAEHRYIEGKKEQNNENN